MRTRINQNKEQIFCEWRHRWVRLTPEEWVRQQLLHRLVEQLNYPASLIAVEVPFQSSVTNDQSPISAKKFRADAVVYNRLMQPLLIIECKAETVPLTQRTLDQATTYNRRFNVPYLLLHNGPQSLFVTLSDTNTTTSSVIPPYNDL